MAYVRGVRRALKVVGALAAGARTRTKSKVASKRPGARTRTKTKNKRSRSRVSSSAGINNSNFTVVLKKKAPKYGKGRWDYTQTNVLAGNASSGMQAFEEVTALGTISQLNVSTGVGYSALQAQVALRQLNPNFWNTGSNYLPGGTNPTTDQYVLKSMKSVCEFTSWCDVAQEVDLYWFVNKQGTQDSVRTVWERGYQQQGSGIGSMTTLTSPLYQGVAGYGKVNEPFANPNDVKRYLGQVWKVIKHTKVMLQSGATHTVTLNIIANKVIKQSTVDQAELDGEIALPGVTVYLIAIVRGQIVKDTLVASTRPTFSETSVGYVCRNSYVCHPVDGP